MHRPDFGAADEGGLPRRAGGRVFDASTGMPEATPWTKLYWADAAMPLRTYTATLRTMPRSKHSNSGRAPVAAIASSMVLILDTGLSNSIGGQAQAPSSFIFR